MTKFTLALLACSISFSICGQNAQLEEMQRIHNEVEDDPYVFVDRNSMPKSPAYNVRESDFFTTQVNVDSNGDNIVGDAANEPSIAVDPTDPTRIVIGWRQFDNINSNFRQAGYGYSTDSGASFTFPGPINPGVFRSDPVLDFDGEGNFYYNSLQGTFECDVYKIEDGGTTWEGPYPAFGGDKQWMAVDRTTGIGSRNNYSNWNASFTTCAPGYFTRSTDGSENFESCIEIDGNPFWGTLAVDDNGDLFITGTSNTTGEYVVIKSSNAKDPNATISWDFVTEVDLDGQAAVGQFINPQGLTGQAWVAVDLNNDNVYVLSSVLRNSVGDPADVMFAKSTDRGATFAPPIRINTDSGTDAFQWFGTMSVAPNGRIDVVWLDTRDAPAGTVDSVLYYSYSEDEGETWSVNEPMSIAFDPTIGYPQQNKMGDYFDMKSDNDAAHLAWANTINGGQDVYYTRIEPALLGIDELNTNALGARMVPNPIADQSTLYFEAFGPTTVAVYDLQGSLVAEIVRNENLDGPQELIWQVNNGQELSSGLYFVNITSGDQTANIKVVLR